MVYNMSLSIQVQPIGLYDLVCDIMNINPCFYCKKVFHDLLNLLPKAEGGLIELNQCQLNNSPLEATYYIYPCINLQFNTLNLI